MDVYFRAPLLILFIGLFSRFYLTPRSNADASNPNGLSGFHIKTESLHPIAASDILLCLPNQVMYSAEPDPALWGRQC